MQPFKLDTDYTKFCSINNDTVGKLFTIFVGKISHFVEVISKNQPILSKANMENFQTNAYHIADGIGQMEKVVQQLTKNVQILKKEIEDNKTLKQKNGKKN